MREAKLFSVAGTNARRERWRRATPSRTRPVKKVETHSAPEERLLKILRLYAYWHEYPDRIPIQMHAPEFAHVAGLAGKVGSWTPDY